MRPAPQTYYVAVGANQAMFALAALFNERQMLTGFWQDGQAYRIRTGPTEEPDLYLRHRRTSYAIRAEVFPNRPDCTWIQVRWVVQTRAYRDDSWRTEPFDRDFEPEMLWSMGAVFKGKRCPPAPPEPSSVELFEVP